MCVVFSFVPYETVHATFDHVPAHRPLNRGTTNKQRCDPELLFSIVKRFHYKRKHVDIKRVAPLSGSYKIEANDEDQVMHSVTVVRYLQKTC